MLSSETIGASGEESSVAETNSLSILTISSKISRVVARFALHNIVSCNHSADMASLAARIFCEVILTSSDRVPARVKNNPLEFFQNFIRYSS